MPKVRISVNIKSPLGSYNLRDKEFDSVEAYDKYMDKAMKDHSKGKIIGIFNYEEFN